MIHFVLQLDDWVLCRIYNKKGTLEKHINVDQKEVHFSDSEDQKPNLDSFQFNRTVAPAPPSQSPQFVAPKGMNDHMHYASDSVPKFHTDSSSSLSSEFMTDKEVESELKWNELDKSLDFPLNYLDGFQDDPFTSQMQFNDQVSMFQDLFGYVQKPF